MNIHRIDIWTETFMLQGVKGLQHMDYSLNSQQSLVQSTLLRICIIKTPDMYGLCCLSFHIIIHIRISLY